MIAHALRFEIEKYAARFMASNAVYAQAERGTLDTRVIAHYLVSLRHLVGVTPEMLSRARHAAIRQGRPELAIHFEHKDAEEAGHDVWAENDITVLRTTKAVSHGGGPAKAILDLCNFLRGAIDSDARHYLAYMLFAEYFTVLVGAGFVQNLVTRCGVPAEAMTCIARHVELDRDHTDEGLEVIDAQVDDPTMLAPMRDVVRRTFDFYDRFSEELLLEPHLPQLDVAV